MSGYKTVVNETEYLLEIERSKFLCSVKGIESEEQAKEYLSYIKKKYSDASHHCYAYIADEKGLIFKFSDDREPQGTAGMPILNVLKGKKLYKVIAVVTRWFGGIKLGAGGLARAYGNATDLCLRNAKEEYVSRAYFYNMKIEYSAFGKLQNFFSEYVLAIKNIDFSTEISLDIAYSDDNEISVKEFCEKAKTYMAGNINIRDNGEGYHPFSGKYVKDN